MGLSAGTAVVGGRRPFFRLCYNSKNAQVMKMAQMKLSDLSVEEFKALVRETVSETIAELFQDPDEGLELRDEVKEMLRQSLSPNTATKSATVVAADLGLQSK